MWNTAVCRRCIRAALIQQTEIHFRQYAKQQFPDSPQQVCYLFTNLSLSCVINT